MLVFSTLYALEEQNISEITYKTLSDKLVLSESSIRDYTNKLIKKGVPIDKTRQNNKIIVLKISKDLKNIASLATINSLRAL
jgi:biotin operon repressor